MTDVVSLHIDQGIALVQMADRVARNTFSRALIEGLNQVFDQIATELKIKVVVITGYDNYFCCGGTQEELRELSQTKMTFAELGFYRLLLDCPVPTIAAMQGHSKEPKMDAIPQTTLLALIQKHACATLPYLKEGEIQPTVSLKDLGANSLDRADIAIACLQELNLTLPMAILAKAQNIQGLIDILNQALISEQYASLTPSLVS